MKSLWSSFDRDFDGDKLINKYYEIVAPYGLLYPDWYSLSYDGHFYETDVAIQLESGYSPYKGPIIFGTNSYEGTLLYFDPNFQPDSLKSRASRWLSWV